MLTANLTVATISHKDKEHTSEFDLLMKVTLKELIFGTRRAVRQASDGIIKLAPAKNDLWSGLGIHSRSIRAWFFFFTWNVSLIIFLCLSWHYRPFVKLNGRCSGARDSK